MRKFTVACMTCVLVLSAMIGTGFAAQWYYTGQILQTEVTPTGTFIRIQRSDNQQYLRKVIKTNVAGVDVNRILATVLTALSNGWQVKVLYDSTADGWVGIMYDNMPQ